MTGPYRCPKCKILFEHQQDLVSHECETNERSNVSKGI